MNKKSILSKSPLRITSSSCILIIFLLLIFFTSAACAANWFVSTKGAGSKNGTSVDNAWPQTGIVWGSMKAGDTLYVVGVLHGLTSFYPTTSGSTNNYFTISGYGANSGIVAGYEYDYTKWTGPDASGVYSLSYTANLYGLIEWSTDPLQYTKLVNAGSKEAMTEGTYYWDNANDVIYWKPVGGTITGKTATTHLAMAIRFNDVSWIKVTNLKTVNILWSIGDRSSANHIWLDHITIANSSQYTSWGAAVQIGLSKTNGGSDNIRISYCTIYDGDNGIYTFAQYTGQNNDNITIDHNTITNMSGNNDAHCIGLQGGSNNTIEYNNLSYCNTGITIFSYGNPDQQTNNNIIRYNHVHHMEGTRAPDLKNMGYNRGYGIGWEGNVVDPSLRTGNQVYNNIVHDCYGNYPYGIGIKGVKGSSNYTNNNTVRNCAPNYQLEGNSASVGVSGVFKNNISLDPGGTTKLHWKDGLYNNGDYSGLSIDNNLYYPDGNKFYLKGIICDFANWKMKLNAVGVVGYDGKSDSVSPLLSNSTGQYSWSSDFKPAANSPVINKGDNSVYFGKPGVFDFTGSVQITDGAGAIVAPGGIVDIGAYEVSGAVSSQTAVVVANANPETISTTTAVSPSTNTLQTVTKVRKPRKLNNR